MKNLGTPLSPATVRVMLLGSGELGPESFVKRRMGVALAFDADVEVARNRAKEAAGKVQPRAQTKL